MSFWKDGRLEKAVCRMSSERDRHTDKQRNLAAHKQTHTSMETQPHICIC